MTSVNRGLFLIVLMIPLLPVLLPAQNNAIFGGSTDDGFGQAGFVQPLNNTIFAGDQDDGFGQSIYAQPLHNNIFLGDRDDGFHVASYVQLLNNAIFAGDRNDGFYQISFVIPTSELQIEAVLQGPYDALSSAMRADLVTANLLQSTAEPYSAMGHELQNPGAVIDPAVFSSSNPVDWVLVELRDAVDHVFAARAVLITDKGELHEADGRTNVHFRSIPAGDYFVAIRHRNHLAMMTRTVQTVTDP